MIIYKATNMVNNKVYIGKTNRTLKHRIINHISDMKKNSNIYFHNALRKYGENNFLWEILSETNSESKLNVLEKFYIAIYRKITKVYNLTNGGEGTYGFKFTKENLKNLSLAHKGQIPFIQKGKTYEEIYGTEEAKRKKEKISKTGKGRIPWNKGLKTDIRWHQTDDAKQKISKARKGKKLSEEHKQKLRKPHMRRLKQAS
jgi:group I intron endonuclease